MTFRDPESRFRKLLARLQSKNPKSIRLTSRKRRRRFLVELMEPRMVLASITGTDNNDTLTSTNAADTLTGLAGDDVYVFSNGFGQDVVVEATNKGKDTLDFSRVTTNLTFTFNADGSVDIVDSSNNANSVRAANIENLIGGQGNDTYRFLSGARGSFHIDETPGGQDTFDFSPLTTAITFDLGSTVAQTVTTNLELTLSSVNAFEHVIGGSAADRLTGNDLDNRLTGNGGNDVLIGGFGDDTYILSNNGGVDTITEADENGAGEDTLDFSSVTGNVTVRQASDGSFSLIQSSHTIAFDNIEHLRGGTGTNTLDFASAPAGLVVNLLKGTATEFLSISGFRNVTGSRFNDSLIGDASANVLSGGDGDDILSGGNGADSLDGGNGADRLYEQRDVNFTLTNTNLTATGGGINGSEQDTLTSLELAELVGGFGANTINASAFTGNVTLDGGSIIPLASLNGGQGVRRTNSEQTNLAAASLLSELNQGNGVRRVNGADFRITLTDGKTIDVDLTNSVTTIQNVIDAVTTAANAVENGRLLIEIDADTQNSLLLRDTKDLGGDLSVTALNSSFAAEDLGVLRTGSGPYLSGLPISDTSHDLRITLSDGTRLDVNLSSVDTVDELLTKLNQLDPQFTVRLNNAGQASIS